MMQQRGISLLEVLLVLMVVASIIVFGLRNYSQYIWTKNVNEIQQNVDQLLQGGSAYYYANCVKNFNPLGEIKQEQLLAAGVVNEQVFNNPWGNQAFSVWIIGTPGNYLIQVQGTFDNFPAENASNNALGQLAHLLDADTWTGNKTLTWTRLPDQGLRHLQWSAQSPANWTPVISGTNLGGIPLTSPLWVMKSGLAVFSKQEAEKTSGFTCPN